LTDPGPEPAPNKPALEKWQWPVIEEPNGVGDVDLVVNVVIEATERLIRRIGS